MKVSFIATILNEEKTIISLLTSLAKQTQKPDEIIIVDGGSIDKTITKIKAFQKKHPQIKIRLFFKKGANRSQGRNLAIKKAKNEIIAISDAGCELDKNWLKNIIQPFKDPSIKVTAGYYKPKAESIFQKCVATYALIVPHRVKPKKFLPTSRSMAILKKTWKKFAGFPEKFPDNEDFVFANTLKKGKAKIVFIKNALVYWYPRSNLKSFWIMIYRFAKGDAFAGLRYPKTATVLGRYLIGALLLIFSFKHHYLLFYWLFCALVYLIWPIFKNYRYIKKWPALFLLPLLQIITDTAIILGTIKGIAKKIICRIIKNKNGPL